MEQKFILDFMDWATLHGEIACVSGMDAVIKNCLGETLDVRRILITMIKG